VTATGQLAALLGLRWRMLRTPSAKATAVLVLVLLVWLLFSAVRARAYADDAGVSTVLEIAPGLFLGFAVLALIAPLTAGGGHELVPQDQLVAYPVRPSTLFLGGLVLAPANLVWGVQLLVLVGTTSVLALGRGLPLALLTTALYVLVVTLLGQALAWFVVGARQSRRGRRAVLCVAAAVAVAVPFLLQSGLGTAMLNSGPAFDVVLAVIAAGGGRLESWAPTAAAMLVLAAVTGAAGVRACAWAVRRPSDAVTSAQGRPLRRRRVRPGALRTLVAVDRASAWRAPALRRGGVVIVVLPGLVVATLDVPWESLVVMPGLVAAGAGLLFGVNAFALDGAGALWLASLPYDPRLAVLSKLAVLAETVLLAVGLAAVVGALRSGQSPTGAQVSAMVGAAVACSAVVVALCLRDSVRRPARADLQGPRDAVAPPGALAAASARLALPCAVVAMLCATAAQSRFAWFPLLVASPFVLLSLLSVMRSTRRYADPVVRARVVHTVASG
jgi:hypothetical protein